MKDQVNVPIMRVSDVTRFLRNECVLCVRVCACCLEARIETWNPVSKKTGRTQLCWGKRQPTLLYSIPSCLLLLFVKPFFLIHTHTHINIQVSRNDIKRRSGHPQSLSVGNKNSLASLSFAVSGPTLCLFYPLSCPLLPSLSLFSPSYCD